MALTPFEEFIATYWWQLGSVLVMAIGGYWKLDSIKKSVDDHHDPKNPSPHPNCVLHTELLKKIDDKLTRIDERQIDFFERLK